MNSAHHTIAMPRTQRLQREGSPSIAPDRANKMAGRTNAAQEVPGERTILSHSFADVSLLIGYKLQMNIGRELGSMALSGHKRRALIASPCDISMIRNTKAFRASYTLTAKSLERETKAHREKYSQPQVFFPPPHTPCEQAMEDPFPELTLRLPRAATNESLQKWREKNSSHGNLTFVVINVNEPKERMSTVSDEIWKDVEKQAKDNLGRQV
ncbi:hypothetical protein An12g08310 [Aspergillus niger]|uniref:Uncharacterized protein n=2 Tax=Aspergillus niger TaxID=5061 RepID=A2R0E3_ASPNC|nr:hypothetical protein An12g08310 [Aspergillus niger]CAK41281.1 hypothetical protein An12g08310 [Aspergillus niger]